MKARVDMADSGVMDALVHPVNGTLTVFVGTLLQTITHM